MRGIRGSVVLVCVALALVVGAITCTKVNPDYCEQGTDCGPGRHCNFTQSPNKNSCVPNDDGGPEGGMGDGGSDANDGNATDGSDAADVNPGCATNDQCIGVDGGPVCDIDAGRICVGCLASTDCKAPNPACDLTTKTCVECNTNAYDPDCSGTKPICQAQKCRACKADTECPSDPGICMPDGHCATVDEVVYVENKTGGCGASPTGTSAMPFCMPVDGANVMSTLRNVLVIRGPVDGRLSFGTSTFDPIVIGKMGSSGEAPTISATTGTGIAVTSGNVLVRDLAIIDGSSASMSKGVSVVGSSAKLTLINVVIDLSKGTGAQAEGGSTLVMDRCVVENNMTGGIVINGATYDIQNTIISANGPFGVQFSAAAIPNPSVFSFNTIDQSGSAAASCDLSNKRLLSNSIVAGSIVSCTRDNSIDMLPSFNAQKPYRLIARLPCPDGNPTSFPDHDIDGDPRPATQLDCGADQFVP